MWMYERCRLMLSILLALSWMTLSVEAENPRANLDSPTNGWHYAGLQEKDTDVRVAYPTPPIDRGAQRGRTLIEGHILNAGKLRQPHRLAVNGNPLPLYVDQNGYFVRPYATGAGSNSIEVKASNGQSLRQVQFYEANSHKTPVRLRVILGWDDPRAELDLHIVTPDGEHAYWADPVMSNSGGLDVDSVDGPGPEMFTMPAPLAGTYLVYVNYWGNYGGGGYNFDEDSNDKEMIAATVSLVFNENTLDEKRETFVVPLRGIGDLQEVKVFRY